MAGFNDSSIDSSLREQNSFYLHEVMEMLEDSVKVQMEGKKAYIPCLSGTPGIGKTTRIFEMAKKMGMEVLYYSMNKPYERYTGLPITSTVSFNSVEERNSAYVYWTMPDLIFLANEMAEKKDAKGKYVNNGCIIFMDDAHIMDVAVQKCFFELVLERQLGNHKLSPRVAMIMAMNNSSQAGFDGFLSAINNRVVRIDVKLEFEDWYKNCGALVNPYIASFLRELHSRLIEKENTVSPFVTPRSWVMLSTHMQRIEEEYERTGDKATFERKAYMYARGYMSLKMAQEFREKLHLQLQFDFESMVRNNAFRIDMNDIYAQLCFGNVVRFLRDDKDVKNLVNFFKKFLKENRNYNIYRNAISNFMFELLAIASMYKVQSDNGDADANKKWKMFSTLQSAMLFEVDKGNGKENIVQLIVNDTLNGKFTLFKEDSEEAQVQGKKR